MFTTETRNDFLYNLMYNIYTKIRSVKDFIDHYQVVVTDENYRKISNATAYYFEFHQIKNQKYDEFLNYLKRNNFKLEDNFKLEVIRIKFKENGELAVSNEMERFYIQYFC
jgi:hypothetical protein